jgi:hypothetical protein
MICRFEYPKDKQVTIKCIKRHPGPSEPVNLQNLAAHLPWICDGLIVGLSKPRAIRKVSCTASHQKTSTINCWLTVDMFGKAEQRCRIAQK